MFDKASNFSFTNNADQPHMPVLEGKENEFVPLLMSQDENYNLLNYQQYETSGFQPSQSSRLAHAFVQTFGEEKYRRLGPRNK